MQMRAALMNGVKEGAAQPAGTTSCPQGDEYFQQLFWMIYSDGLAVTYDQQRTRQISIFHVDRAWLKTHGVVADPTLTAREGAKVGIDRIHRAGKALAMAIDRPCISEEDLRSFIGPDAVRVVLRRTPPAPPAPPMPPSPNPPPPPPPYWPADAGGR